MWAQGDFIAEPARRLPVACEVDLCVVGGSCTGVFAAVRAARLGLSVALVEQHSLLGGMATAAQVNEWHSLYDNSFKKLIIGGLTREVVERLRLRGAVRELPKGGRGQFRFNSAELAAELDTLIREHGIRVFLSARCTAALHTEEQGQDGVVVHDVIIEDKSGRRAIRARAFIDASGDGDLVRQAGLSADRPINPQPVNLQALVSGLEPFLAIVREEGRDWWKAIQGRAAEFGYPAENGTPWFFEYPGASGLVNLFGPRHHGVDGSDADALSAALSEGRRQIRALLDMIEAEFGIKGHVVSWAQALGVRETWHARCLHRLTGQELLHGEPFPDAIANGTYPVDIHHPGGTLLRYLDGREERIGKEGTHCWGRWRDSEESPGCYYIPYRSLVPRGGANVWIAGRCFDADAEAFAGARVMVNMNQTGEAAGTAVALALREGITAAQVDPRRLRMELNRGGSLLETPQRRICGTTMGTLAQ